MLSFLWVQSKKIKKHVFRSVHYVPREDLIKEQINWLGTYLNQDKLAHLVTFGFFYSETFTERLNFAPFFFKLQSSALFMISFHPYISSYRQDFYDLNKSWLKKLFLLEPYDEFVLSNPKNAILDKGGYIFMGKLDGNIVATFALIPSSEGVYELNKMAVHEPLRGKGLGNKIMEFLLMFASEKNIKVIELYSNKQLNNAIHLYVKYGFVEVDITDDNPYKRADIKMARTLHPVSVSN